METLDTVLELDSYNYKRALESLNDSRGCIRCQSLSLDRISSLNFNENESLPVSETFLELCSQITRRIERPQLVALHARCESIPGFRGIESWMLSSTETLVHLTLHMGQNVPPEAFLALLQASSDRLPMLQILQLDAELEHLKPGQRLDLALGITRLCTGLPALTTLHVSFDVVDSDWRQFMTTLSRLPALRELRLSALSTALSILARESYQNSPTGFSRLQVLDISAPPYLCAHALQTLSANISALTWTCPQISDENTLQYTLAEAVSSTLLRTTTYHHRSPSLSTTSINSLFMPRGIPAPVLTMSSLTDVRIAVEDARPNLSIWRCLRPLFSAHGMRTFNIFLPYSLFYTSEDLEDMFQAWPEIRHLSLNPRPSKKFTPLGLPPLAVLSSVATSAPCLEIFAANLDGAVLSPKPTRRWETNVTRLDLGLSVGPEGEDEMMTARAYIDCLFREVHLVDEDCSSWVHLLAHTGDTVS